MESLIKIEERFYAIIYNVLIKRNLFFPSLKLFRKKEIKITPRSDFKNDLGADSLDMVLLMTEFEKEFNIRLEDVDIEKIRTVSQAKKCIRQKMISKSEIMGYSPVRFSGEFVSEN